MSDRISLPFTNAELTSALTLIPNVYGFVNDLDLLPSETIGTTIVQIDSVEGQIYALPTAQRGTAPTVAKNEVRGARFVPLAHVPHLDAITADALQNMFQVGTRTPETLAAAWARRLEQFTRPRHAMTRELMRMGAIKGLVLDGAGNVYMDLFAEFGVTKIVVPFDLANAAADVIGKADAVYEAIGTNLMGSSMTGVEAIVASDFFNALIQHVKVKDTWANYEAASRIANMTRDKRSVYGRSFEFQNVMFREHKGRAQRWDSATNAPSTAGATPYVTAGFGHAYPVGTQNVGVTFDGPPNAVSMVNMPPPSADYVHITQKIQDHDAGVEILSQSNLLPLWKQPKTLIELRIGAV
jgi:Phage major capsid protein E